LMVIIVIAGSRIRAGDHDTVVARVLSTEPFRVEILEDPHGTLREARSQTAVYKPHPIITPISESSDEVKDLRYRDIVTASVGFALTGETELGSQSTFGNIRRVTPPRAKQYNTRGFLIYYRPVRNRPQSYLTIYRDGTVLCHDRQGNEMRHRRLSSSDRTRLIRTAEDAHLDRLVSDERLDEHAPGLILSVTKYQQFRLTNPLPAVKSLPVCWML